MKLKNTFVQGKMNKDVDERLLPKGEYPHAENIRVINSDASDIGAIENVKGNKNLTDFSLTNAKTLGSFVDTSNQKIYWFTTSDEKDLVVEYDYPTGVTSILLEDSRGLLNFSRNFLITGIVKIYNEDFRKDLLIWTDDLNPPRSINIERAKTYGADNFNENQITLIKTPPLRSPEFQFTFDSRSSQDAFADKFLAFAYRYKYRDGEISALSPFSYYAYSPNGLDIDYDTLENRGMINNFNALDLSFETGSSEVVEIEIVFKESNSNTIYSVETFNKQELVINDDDTFEYRFINDKSYAALPEDELFRLFDNVPNKAKALDLVGSRLVFGNYEEGFDIRDESGQDIEIDYAVDIVSQELEAEDLPISIQAGGDELRVDFSSFEIRRGVRISFRVVLEEYSDTGELQPDSIYSDTLDYIINDDINTAQELLELDDFRFFVESTLTEAFNSNANNTPPVNDVAPTTREPYQYQISGSSLVITAPKINYTVADDPVNDPTNTRVVTYPWRFDLLTSVLGSSIAVLSSIKSIRTYEIGLVYVDKYGRSSTVLTSKTNTIQVPVDKSGLKNNFRIQLFNRPPVDAVAYRFAVKQTRGAYENIFATQFFEDGRFVWIKLEGSDKDKVSVGQTLYVKADSSGILSDTVETTVLEITSQPRNFIENNRVDTATGEIIIGTSGGIEIVEDAGVYMKIKPVGFNLAYDIDTFGAAQGSQGLDENRPTVLLHPRRNNGDDFPISKNAIIELKFDGGVEREATNFRFDKTYISSRDYTSFAEWFEREVGLGVVRADGTRPEAVTATREGGGIRLNSRLRGGGKESTSRITASVDIRNANNIAVFETKPINDNNAVFYETAETFDIVDNNHQGNLSNQLSGSPAIVQLDWFNTFALGSGVESISYLDGFNNNSLNIDLRPNAVSLQGFSKVRRFADLTYSEPYTENTNVNGLNEFNLARANFKDDIDKKYGFIQKLHTRDTDLIVFQEDKVHKVLFGKDLLVNADGTSNVTSTEQVLGQHIAFTGEYGISRNPESFSFDANNLYFTDAKRGSVMRLGNNGLTEISNYGMRRYFKDEFRDSLINKKIGSFDPYHDQYVLSLSNDTLSIPITIGCGETFRQVNFSGTLNHILDIGTQQGETGVEFTTNGVPLKVTVEWNGQVYDSGIISDTNTHEIRFDKTSSLPSTASLKIEALDCDAGITLTNVCVEAPIITVVSIVLNDNKDEGLERISRYKWVNGTFESRYRTYNSVFEGDADIVVDGRDARVDLFESVTGEQGENFLPIQGSNIIMESLNSPNNTAEFIEGDRIGYLVTDTEYSEAQIQSIINNATFLSPTEGIIINGDTLKNTSFTLPTTGNRYVYLIWDYVLKNEAPVAVKDFIDVTTGSSITVDITANDTDADGDSLTVGDIVTQPSFGTLSVSGRFITYTHDGSENLDDEFTYRVFDGTEFSEPETVCISVGVPCGQSISPSGNQGTFVYDINIGTGTGLTGIEYEAFRITDRFTVEYDGQVIGDTGFVSGQGTLTFNKTERTPTRMRVTVIASNGGTAWNFRSICPSPIANLGVIAPQDDIDFS